MIAWNLSRAAGMCKSRRLTTPTGIKPTDKEDAECATCRCLLHISALECDCCPGRYVCLHHSDTLCECQPSRWRMLYRYSLAELDEILDLIKAHNGEAPKQEAQQAAGEAAAEAEAKGEPASQAVAESMDVDGAAAGAADASAGAANAAAAGGTAEAMDTAEGQAGASGSAGTSTEVAVKDEAMQDVKGLDQHLAAQVAASHLWCDKVKVTLATGGCKMVELDGLLQEAEQFMWSTSALDHVRWGVQGA